jgi:hypothetical protein
MLLGFLWSEETFLKSVAGLPDGLFSNQKSQFGYILVGLVEKVGSFMTIWNILRPFGKFIVSLV